MHPIMKERRRGLNNHALSPQAQKIAEASSSDESDDLLFAVGHAVDIRARIGWTTDGHT